jgi:hypothetical protein
MPYGWGLTQTWWKLLPKKGKSKAVKVQRLYVLDCVLLQVWGHGRHNNCALWEKATHLLAILQGQAANVLYSIPAEVMCKEIIKVPKSCYGDHIWQTEEKFRQRSMWAQLSIPCWVVITSWWELLSSPCSGVNMEWRKCSWYSIS